MRVFTAVLTGLGALFSVEAFADNDVLLGTGLGAAMGAVVGHQIDHNNGAWVGGAVGAVTGAAIASSNNSTRYVVGDPYYDGYNAYNNAPRRDIYVVEPDYYYQRPPQRPPVRRIFEKEGLCVAALFYGRFYKPNPLKARLLRQNPAQNAHILLYAVFFPRILSCHHRLDRIYRRALMCGCFAKGAGILRHKRAICARQCRVSCPWPSGFADEPPAWP